jgi:ABC-type sugar transport system, permease component
MSIANTAHSVVEPSPNTRRLAGSLVVLYAVITMIPLVWIVSPRSSRRTMRSPIRPKSSSRRRWKVSAISSPRARARRRNSSARWDRPRGFATKLRAAATWCRRTVELRAAFLNSLIIAFGSTVLAVALGTLSAYGFSRFRVP